MLRNRERKPNKIVNINKTKKTVKKDYKSFKKMKEIVKELKLNEFRYIFRSFDVL